MSMDWPVVNYSYPPRLKEWYKEGILFRLWFNLYRGHCLFDERMFSSAQIPHSGPVKNAFGFHEFFMGSQYIDAGYEATCYYREVECKVCFEKAKELFGGEEAAKFITPNTERGGRPPDLLVFDPRTGAFRFVECKFRGERPTKAQPKRFAGIEDSLNRNPPPCKRALTSSDPRWKVLFPPLEPGKWIHMARLVPAAHL